MTNESESLSEFEKRLRSMTKEPGIRLFLRLIDGMSPAAREASLMQQKKLMDSTEALGRMISAILSSEDGANRLREISKNGSGDKS